MNQIIFLGTPYIQRELELSLHSFKDIRIIQEEMKDSNKPVLYLYCGDCEEDKNKYSTTFLNELVEKQLVLPVVKDPNLLMHISQKNWVQSMQSLFLRKMR